MSNTVIYGIKKNKKSKSLISFKNSRGFGLVTWMPYFKTYLNKDPFKKIMEEEDYDKLWPLYQDERLPYHHKVVLQATYDYSMIPVDKLEILTSSLDKWNEDFHHLIEGRVNHVPEISNYIKENMEILKEYDYIGIQVTDTVSNQYDINWNPNGKREISVEKVYNLFDNISF